MLKLLQKLFKSKKQTKKKFGLNFNFLNKADKLNNELYQQIEEKLIKSDLGVKLSDQIINKLKAKINQEISNEEIKKMVKDEILNFIPDFSFNLDLNKHKPFVILMAGVNGSGKTTSIGKIAKKFNNSGKKVILAACDTYRAAAANQLEVWAKRSKVTIVSPQKEGEDPAAVAHRALEKSIAEKFDILLIDTAGRLQNNINLMNQLGKIERVIKKQLDSAPHETIMVIDGTTGQNALKQVNEFKKYLNLTGLIVTKVDGTATGGIVISLMKTENIPTYYVGFGEGEDDLYA